MSKCKVTIIGPNGALVTLAPEQGDLDQVSKKYEGYLVDTNVKTLNVKAAGSVLVVQVSNILAFRVEPAGDET